MFIILILSVFDLSKYNDKSLYDGILNKKWYYYNSTSGNYEILNIDNNKITYYKSQSNSSESEYDLCKSFIYNKKNNIIKLDCNKEFQIVSYNENKLVLINDNKKKVFFNNASSAKNYEFESYYGKSISEYKKEMLQVQEFSKISYYSMIDIMKTNEYSKFVIFGDNCTSTECVLILDVLEKLISMSNNVYYINIDEFSDKQLYNLSLIDSNFSKNRNDYSNVYPKIIITNYGKIIDQYNFICSGFDCNKYINNEF